MLGHVPDSSLHELIASINSEPSVTNIVALIRSTRAHILNGNSIHSTLQYLFAVTTESLAWTEPLEKYTNSLFKQSEYRALSIILLRIICPMNFRKAADIALGWLDSYRNNHFDADILGPILFHFSKTNAKLAMTISSKILMSIHGGKPLFEILKYLVDTHHKAVVTSLLLHSSDSHDYWSFYFHALQHPRHAKELFPVTITLGKSVLFLEHLKDHILGFSFCWNDDFLGDWLFPVLSEYMPLLKSANISDCLLRDTLINCLCLLLDSKDSIASDEELTPSSDTFEKSRLAKFVADNVYVPLNSLWHSQLPTPDILITKTLAGTMRLMSLHGLLKFPITMNASWLQHNQYGIKVYAAVLELWSFMPDVIPQNEYKVARICLNPHDPQICGTLLQDYGLASWSSIGIHMLNRILGSGMSLPHAHLLHKLVFLPTILVAPLIRLVGVYDVQAACSLVVSHFNASNSPSLLELASSLIRMTALNHQHRLSMDLIFSLSQSPNALDHLLATGDVPMLWALHSCCPQLRLQVLMALPMHIDANFLSCAMLLLRAVDNCSLPMALEPFLTYISVETFRQMDAKIRTMTGTFFAPSLPAEKLAWKCCLWVTGKEAPESLFLPEPPTVSHHVYDPTIEHIYCRLLNVISRFAVDLDHFVSDSLSAMSSFLDVLLDTSDSKGTWASSMHKLMLINGLTRLCPDRHHPMHRRAN